MELPPPPPPKESEVEKTARFTRHLLEGIVIAVIVVVIVVALVFAYFAYFSSTPMQTPTPSSAPTSTPASTSTPTPTPISTVPASTVGVKVGEFFTYALSGQANGPVPSTISSDFSIYNDTSFYNVTVTAINGTKVTLDTNWVLRNGTSLDSLQSIDVASGILEDQNGFYALYPANMNANETIYPQLYQGVWINGTDSTTYAGGARDTNYYTATGLLYYSQDPTHSTQASTYDQVNFDKQTGMLTNLVSIRDYNNPVLSTEIIWSLTNTNAWSY